MFCWACTIACLNIKWNPLPPFFAASCCMCMLCAVVSCGSCSLSSPSSSLLLFRQLMIVQSNTDTLVDHNVALPTAPHAFQVGISNTSRKQEGSGAALSQTCFLLPSSLPYRYFTDLWSEQTPAASCTALHQQREAEVPDQVEEGCEELLSLDCSTRWMAPVLAAAPAPTPSSLSRLSNRSCSIRRCTSATL